MRQTRAVGWAYGLTWGRQGIQGITLFILAAILGPTEFGVMALGVIYVGFIEMILQQGFVAAIIQRKVIRNAHVSSVFWMMMLFSILLTTVAVVCGQYWAALNDAPSLTAIISALSLSIPLVALRMVPSALLTRHLQMKSLTVRSLGAAVVSSAVAIPMAFAGFGVWCLVAQHLSYTAASTALVWRAARWRPRLEFQWTAARSLLSFSLANFAARAGSFVATQIDAIVIGFFWGAPAVGLYRLASRCITMALDFLAGPLQFVSFPEFSKLQTDRDKFRASFLTYIQFASLVTWPALAIVALSAPYLPDVLGAQWVGVESALVALALCGAIQTLTQFLGPLLQSLGKPGALAAIVWAQGLLGALCFAAIGSLSSSADVAVQTASVGVAKSLIFVFLPLPALLLLSRRLLGLSSRQMMRATLPAWGCAATVYLIGFTAREGLVVLGWDAIVQLIVLVGLLGLGSLACAAALNAAVRRLVLTAARRYSPSFLIR